MSFKPIFYKDFLIEFRNRYSLSTLLLFVFVTVALFYYNLHSIELKPLIMSTLYWVVIYFAALTGLSRGFLIEEDKGTILFLQLFAKPLSVFTAKVLFNIVIINIVNILASILFSLLITNFIITNILHYFLNTIIVSSSIAIIITLLSAIISKVNNKSSLLAVLSFPTLLPIILLGSSDLSKVILETQQIDYESFIFLVSYCGIMTTLSFLLFEFIWKD
jgi:heme exporter protein B